MKLLLSLSLLLTSTFSWGWTFSEIQGTYRARPAMWPAAITVVINSQGQVGTTLRVFGKTYLCNAPAVLENDVLKASFICNHDKELDLEIDLREVQDLRRFRTDVETSIAGRLRVTFTKVN